MVTLSYPGRGPLRAQNDGFSELGGGGLRTQLGSYSPEIHTEALKAGELLDRRRCQYQNDSSVWSVYARKAVDGYTKRLKPEVSKELFALAFDHLCGELIKAGFIEQGLTLRSRGKGVQFYGITEIHDLAEAVLSGTKLPTALNPLRVLTEKYFELEAAFTRDKLDFVRVEEHSDAQRLAAGGHALERVNKFAKKLFGQDGETLQQEVCQKDSTLVEDIRNFLKTHAKAIEDFNSASY